jgi:multiple sugar transport system permease protein
MNKSSSVPYLYFAPIILLLFLVLGIPEVISLYYSLSTYPLGGSPTFTGFSNYVQLASNSEFYRALIKTLIYVSFTIPLEMLLGLGFALLVNRKFAGKKVIIALLLSPFAVNPVVAAIMWRSLFNSNFGLINYLLTFLGFEMGDFLWLTNPVLAFVSIILVDVWLFTPVIFILLYAACAALPTDVYEAARIDGASAWHQVRYITLPLIRPALLVAITFRTMEGMRDFSHIFVMTGGGPADYTTVLSLYLYKVSFNFYRLGEGSAIAWVLTLLTVIISGFYIHRLYRTTYRVAANVQ